MAARKYQKMNANAKPGQGQIAEWDLKECGRPRPPGLNEVGEDAHAPWFFGITLISNFFQKSATSFSTIRVDLPRLNLGSARRADPCFFKL